MTLILFPYKPNERPEDQLETTLLYGTLKDMRFNCLRLPTTDQRHEYVRVLRENWLREELVIIEHDVVPTIDMVNWLIKCDHSICAQAFYLYPKSTNLKEPVIAHRDASERWIKQGVAYAPYWSLGATKITLLAQKVADLTRLDELPRGKWLDGWLSEKCAAAGLFAHIHYPVAKHNHQ
jgi:hypothetical protein